MSERPHFVTVWGYLSRFFFLLIVPLVQAVLQAPFSELAWGNLPGVLAVTGIACFQYLSCGYGIKTVQEGKASISVLYWKSGLFFQRQTLLPADCIASVFLRMNPLLDIFGAAKVMLDSPAANAKKPSITLLLHKKELMQWWQQLRATIYHRYRASPMRVMLMAVSWSNPATGLLLIGLLVNRASQLLGEEMTRQLYASVNQTQRLIALGLPPAVAVFGWLLGMGWLIAFLVQFFRYAFFTAGASTAGTMISRGMLVRSRQLLTDQSVRAVSVRQTLFMLVLRLSSVYLHTIGSGKEKGDRSLLLAAATQKELKYHLNKFYPEEAPYFFEQGTCIKIKPPLQAWFGYLSGAMFQGCGVLALYWIFTEYLPLFAPLILFLLVFPLYQLLLRGAALRTSFLAVTKDHIAAGGYVHSQLYTAVIPKSALQSVVIRQNIWQQKNGRCNVRLCIGTEKGACFDLRHFRVKDVDNLGLTEE